MMTSSNGNIFRVTWLLALCAGNATFVLATILDFVTFFEEQANCNWLIQIDHAQATNLEENIAHL